VQHFINGMQTIDVTDEDAANAPKEGLLALQIHQGPPMVVQFKNFKLVETQVIRAAPVMRLRLFLRASRSRSASIASAVADTEYIVVSGGPAVRTVRGSASSRRSSTTAGGETSSAPPACACRRFTRPRPQGTHITWLVYRDGYVRRACLRAHQPLTQNIESVPKAYPFINLVWFRSTDELIRYINEGGMSRWSTKISGFEYFGHSNKYSFMFDYSSDIYANSVRWLHQTDLETVSTAAPSPKTPTARAGAATRRKA
jgi:hypothetical protein